MYATLNESGTVLGYSIEPGENSFELTEEEYMRQISSNGYFTHVGENTFEEHSYEPSAPTEEEVIETKQIDEYMKRQEAIREVAMLNAVSMAPALSEKQLLKIRHVFPQWRTLIGEPLIKATTPYIMHEDDLYLVNQDHTPQVDWIPGQGTEALYSKVSAPGSISPWVQPTGAHDAYNKPGSGLPKSDPVTHNDQTWVSTINADVWEPGVYGWVVHQI